MHIIIICLVVYVLGYFITSLFSDKYDETDCFLWPIALAVVCFAGPLVFLAWSSKKLRKRVRNFKESRQHKWERR